MKGLILSGGHGTRLRPITYTLQKQLVPVANRPIIFYVIDDLVDAGIRDIGIIVGPNKEQVIETVGDGSRWSAKITYIVQERPGGLAHAILTARDFLDEEDFIMYLGDNLLFGGINHFVDEFEQGDNELDLMLTEVPNPEDYGIALVDEQKKVITKLLEKPKDPPTNLSIVGVYGFRKSIFTAISNIKPSWRGELEVTDAMQWLIENGYKAGFKKVQGWWKDTGNAESLLSANHLILDDKIRHREMEKMNLVHKNRQGRIQIGKDCRISDGAVIRGPVIIGDNCVIGDDVFIGPYTAIGNKVKLLKGEVGNSIIMDDVTINAKRRIINSILGRGARYEKKSAIPHGNVLVIGDNSVVLS